MWGEVGGVQREVLGELLLCKREWDGSARLLDQRIAKVTYNKEHVLQTSERSARRWGRARVRRVAKHGLRGTSWSAAGGRRRYCCCSVLLLLEYRRRRRSKQSSASCSNRLDSASRPPPACLPACTRAELAVGVHQLATAALVRLICYDRPLIAEESGEEGGEGEVGRASPRVQ